MKKMISMLLLAAFCLSMAACSSVDKEFESADALLQAGDYDGAIAAFSAIGRYEEINSKIQEAEKLRDEANAGFLYGTWKDILYEFGGESDLVIKEDGKAIIAGMTATYTYENGVLTITSPMIIEFDCEETDGVMHLRGSLDSEMDYVPESAYDELGPYSVELSIDNWAEYFELKQAANVTANGFGEIEYVANGYGVFLKDEYLDKINQQSFYSNEIAFKISYDTECFALPVSSYEEAYRTVFDINELEKVESPYYWDDFESTGKTETATLNDYRHYSNMHESNSYANCVAAPFYYSGDVTEHNGVFIGTMPVNVQVVQVQGNLVLFR